MQKLTEESSIKLDPLSHLSSYFSGGERWSSLIDQLSSQFLLLIYSSEKWVLLYKMNTNHCKVWLKMSTMFTKQETKQEYGSRLCSDIQTLILPDWVVTWGPNSFLNSSWMWFQKLSNPLAVVKTVVAESFDLSTSVYLFTIADCQSDKLLRQTRWKVHILYIGMLGHHVLLWHQWIELNRLLPAPKKGERWSRLIN